MVLVALWACPLLAAICAAIGISGRRPFLVACALIVALPFVAALAVGIVAPTSRTPGSDDFTWAGSLFLAGCFAVAAALIGLLLGGVGWTTVRLALSRRRAVSR